MKEVDWKAIFDCINQMFLYPSSRVKMILEDANWQPGGIDWDNDAEVEELRKRISIILDVVFEAARNRLEEYRQNGE